MKTSHNILIFVGVILGVFFLVWMNLTGLHENVLEENSNLAAAYQERADLIPNLVATVQGAVDHEEAIITKITDSRKNLNTAIHSGNTESMKQADEQLSETLDILVENYPAITASDNFRALQDQLEGSENRIRVARNYYNKAINSYNRFVKLPIVNVFASILGYESYHYFQAEEGTETAPEVSFN